MSRPHGMNTHARRILFICMPIVDLAKPEAQKDLFDARAIVNLPYGLMSICTYVHAYARAGVELRIINVNDQLATEYRNNNFVPDGQAFFGDFVDREARRFNADVVGISVMFNVNYLYLDSIAARIREALPKAAIIVGGSLATVLHAEIAARDVVDAVVYGEGEIPMLQLADSSDIYDHVNSSPEFVTKSSLKAGRLPINLFVPDLDSIPPIDFTYVNLANFNLPRQKGTVYKKEFALANVARIIYVSRGCPYDCNFCAGFNVHGKKVRFASVERVVADVQKMIDEDGLAELFVCDDSFLIDKARAKTILAEFVRMGIDVSFPAILMRNIDDEVATLLAKLGNTFQYTSMESGSEHVLRSIIQKPLSMAEAQKAVDSLRKYGISVLTNIVVGSPGETDEHRQETLRTLHDIGFSWVFFMIAMPVPGSRLYTDCEEHGYLVSEAFDSPSLTKCNIRTPAYSPEHVEWQAYMMNLHTNFVHNYNLRVGNYDECVVSFTNVAKSYPDHAFAYYGLTKAYEGRGEMQLAHANRRKFEGLVAESAYWRDWAVYFELV